MKFLRKQSMQLSSKMRFLAAQILALAEGDLWLHNAKQANAMARRLAEGVKDLPNVKITQTVEANAVFAMMPQEMVERLQQDFQFYVWNEKNGEVRWMTNWATDAADVDEFVKAIRASHRDERRLGRSSRLRKRPMSEPRRGEFSVASSTR